MNASDEQPGQPPSEAPPRVLPYRAGEEATPPADDVYKQFGFLSLVLAGVAASYVVAYVVGNASGVWKPAPGTVCCFGVLPWVVSIVVATRVTLHSAGRRWALLALAVDLALVLTLVLSSR